MTASKHADSKPTEPKSADAPVQSPSSTAGSTESVESVECVELASNFRVPIGLAAIAIPILLWNLWVGSVLELFAVFLAVQAATLRLIFTPTALDVYRGEKLIRHFPYDEWKNWDIFWQYTPILFFFREVNSIHFLPILFDPAMLRRCLEDRQLPTQRSWD